MTRSDSIFPTFFLTGFECSTFVWKDRGRRDLVAETQHLALAHDDYQHVQSLGIGVCREGIPWCQVDHGGRYDFSCIAPLLDAVNAAGVTPIWDLFHYGYPDDIHPLAEAFPDRFARYCRAVAEYVVPRTSGPRFFTPVNEITFLSHMGGQAGVVAPFLTGRENRDRLRLALCRAAIAGVKAIRAVDPEARMVHVDPMVNVVAPSDRPDLAEAARVETYEQTPFAWDVLAGMNHPEMGGGPEVLDIVSISHYAFSQLEYREDLMFPTLPEGDDRFLPLRNLLCFLANRYGRPVVIAETSGFGDGRAGWLRYVAEEALAARGAGVDVQGICLYPFIGMPDWYTGDILQNGFYDLSPEAGVLHRTPNAPYIAELRHWQEQLGEGHADRQPHIPA